MQTPKRRCRGTRMAAAFVLAAPVLAGLTGPVRAQSPTAGVALDSAVSLDVKDARLSEVIAMLTKRTGISNIVIESPSHKGYNLITLTLADQPIGKMLRYVALAAGATLSEEEGIYFIRPRAEKNAATTASATPDPAPDTATTAPVQTVDSAQAVVVTSPAAVPSTSRVIGPKQFVKITLQYLKPSDFTRLLQNSEYLVMDNGPLTRLQPTAMDPLQITPVNPSVPIVPLSNGVTNPEAPGGFTAGRTGSAADTVNAAGQRFGRAGGFQQPGGQPGGIGGAGQGGAGQATSLLPEGVDPPIAYDVDNSLLVRGDPEGLDQLRDIIRLLDIPPKQVQIKAEFVDVRISDLDDFGIEWQIRAANNIGLSLPAGADVSSNSISLRYASGNAVATLRAAVTRQTSNILQAPIISTINNVPASIQVGDQIPIFSQQVILTNNVAQTVTVVNYINVSNGLQVLPRINGDNSITMFLTPQLQNAEVITSGSAQAPQVTQRALTTYRRIQNGETMVLGGFISKTESKQLNRTPFLSDLPIIGSLFRSRRRSVTGSEILVFVTATIIEDRALGTVGIAGGGTPAPTP